MIYRRITTGKEKEPTIRHYQRLCVLETAIERGALVFIPPIGSTVYSFVKQRNGMTYDFQVAWVEVHDEFIIVCDEDGYEYYLDYDVFRTEKEAEERQKEWGRNWFGDKR